MSGVAGFLNLQISGCNSVVTKYSMCCFI